MGEGGRLSGGGGGPEFNFSPEGVAGVAVDADGNLFVFGGFGRLFKFGEDGTMISAPFAVAAKGRGLNHEYQGIAIDPSGNLVFPEMLWSAASSNLFYSSLRFEPGTEDLYITQGFIPGGRVKLESPNCATPCPADFFGAGVLGDNPRGVTVLDHGSGTAYVADSSNDRVAVFGAVPFLPDETATAVIADLGVGGVSGTVDPAGAGALTGCHFQYVTSAAFKKTGYSDLSSGGSIPCAEGQSFPAASSVHAEATGLDHGTEYHFRLLGENGNGVRQPGPTL